MAVVFDYMPHDGEQLFTLIASPDAPGKYPTVIMRSPYEAHHNEMNDDELRADFAKNSAKWTDNGYIFIMQDCKGTGRSTGDSDAFVYEHEESRALLDYVRRQDFYNGEIFLTGGSYCGWVICSYAPYDEDIKGIVLEATDCELYNFLYLNSFYRASLHGIWYVDRYKRKGNLNKNFSSEKFLTLPMTEYSKEVFGEPCPVLDETFLHPDRDDPFWDTPMGGMYQRNTVKNARIPMLVTTGFFDIFCGGGHAMWDMIDEDVKKNCAFVVHPYSHGGTSEDQPYHFNDGELRELMGEFDLRWFEHIRRGTEPPAPLGKITYYELFDNNWHSEGYYDTANKKSFTLGSAEAEYDYDPRDPAPFNGGLSNNFGGTTFMDKPGTRGDVITCYTHEFAEDVHVRGKMSLTLRVKSDCPDTAFYARIGVVKPEGDFALRDSITKISNVTDDYKPGEYVTLQLELDPSALLIKKGERLRVDITSSAFPLFVPHTNNKGLFSIQDTARVAHNAVDLAESSLTVHYR